MAAKRKKPIVVMTNWSPVTPGPDDVVRYTLRVGPRNYWEEGDRIRVPERARGYPYHDVIPAFDGEVVFLDPDGLAVAREPEPA